MVIQRSLPSIPGWICRGITEVQSTGLTAWRLAVWLLAGGPLLWLVWRVVDGRLGPNPVEFLEHYSGDWALRLLLATLALTPLRRWGRRAELLRVRRLLGLWAFAWVCLHFAIYLTFDLEWSARLFAEDLRERAYISLGFAAWLLLVPLALTSTRGWQHRLGRRWRSLHRLVYPAALLGALHFLWLVKADAREPLVYLGVLMLLLWLRCFRDLGHR